MAAKNEEKAKGKALVPKAVTEAKKSIPCQ